MAEWGPTCGGGEARCEGHARAALHLRRRDEQHSLRPNPSGFRAARCQTRVRPRRRAPVYRMHG
eukprot:15452548-Alexandrium_andersonii.AAC.1